MILILSKNIRFKDRKQAKKYLGCAYYNRLLKQKDILLINTENHIANNGATNKNNKGGDLRNHTFQLPQQFERTCCHDRQARFIADSCVLEIHRGTVQAAKG